MFTKNIKDTFTASLLSAVSGVLGEAKKKCSADCKCEACMKEGYMPTNDMPSDKDRKTAGKLGALLKREREAKEKKEPNGVKTEEVEDLDEKRGLWDNIHAKQERIKHGSGERMRKPGSKGAPTAQDFKDSQKESVELDEEHQYVEITNAHTNSKSYIPVHKTQAFAALNHYRSFSHNKGVRIIDKKQHDAIQAAKTPWNPSGMNEAWVVKKGTEVVSSHKSKDEADVKAMKNPMYKVCAKEEAEIEEAVGDITVKKISPDEAFKKHTGQMTKKTSVPRDPKTGKTLYQKVTSEEVEQIDELSKATMGRYINKAATKMGSQGVTAGLKIAADEKSSKNFKDMGKREKGIKLAVNKLTKEEQDFIDSLNDADIEQIDELSDATLKSYAKKAMDQATSAHGYQKDAEKSGDHDRARREMKHKWKRQVGARNAIDRLGNNTLAKEEAEQIDEISKSAALKYLSANKKDDAKARETGDYDRMTKRMRGTDMAVRKYTAKPGSKSVRVPATEEVELDEARGRPKKAGAKDFTIHPRTKEKLMHDNPAHMKKIELLQKNRVLDKPKIEAGQNIMTQLQKAKTSMTGGTKIHFTHGDSTEVSGTHAARLLDKHAGMKPAEKEAFQKKIGHSHANLKSEL